MPFARENLTVMLGYSGPLQVAIDNRHIPDGTGIARYRTNLSAALTSAGLAVVPIGDGGHSSALPPLMQLPGIVRGRARGTVADSSIHSPDLYRLAQRRFSLTGRATTLVLDAPPQLALWSYPMPLRLAGALNIYTVHDIIPMEKPELTAISAARQDRLLASIAATATHIITVSQTVRVQLLERFGLGEERVTCCYQAVDVGQIGELPAGLTRGGYVLMLGRVESRKNIERLVRAYNAADIDLPLVLAGPDGHWTSQAEERRTAALIEASNVFRLPWQESRTISALIAGARALLMPSLSEGFGLPVIEAMSLGVPTMISSGGATFEIAGGAALAVDPFDVEAMARGIVRLHRDQALRCGLVEQGIARARDFGIEAFGQRLLQLCHRFL